MMGRGDWGGKGRRDGRGTEGRGKGREWEREGGENGIRKGVGMGGLMEFGRRDG